MHYTLTFVHEGYGRATSFGNLFGDTYIDTPSPYGNTTRRANATFVILARNSDLEGTVQSIREIEERFNRHFQYPYVVLNEQEFTANFKERISVLTRAKVEFGLIPHDDWFQPEWINEDKAAAARTQMVNENIIYGGIVSYRNMCRFNSGFFFKHQLLLPYKWYWRIEPDVHFHCDIPYDPFVFMEDTNKVYGFTITMYEFEKTIPTLWRHVLDFIKAHPEYIAQGNSMGFLSGNSGKTYNLCHFWSNFEIADMDFWRAPAYQAFFDYLDRQGGFYYERWGDAPVHSIAAGLFAKKEQIHFFNEIGYEHQPYTHCPRDEAVWRRGKCSCDRTQSFDYDGYSCLRKWT
ncbi:alpha-1,2-mannosyltransferase [Hymenopellis radicata]|nr:alpha-1,2-mannosyltransferase [Hymenopellis radicata]